MTGSTAGGATQVRACHVDVPPEELDGLRRRGLATAGEPARRPALVDLVTGPNTLSIPVRASPRVPGPGGGVERTVDP